MRDMIRFARYRLLIALALLVTVVTVICTPAYGASGGWIVRSPLPAGVPFFDVVYGQGRFVAVGGGASLTSEDGIKWEVSNIAGRPSLMRVKYLNNRFIAVGQAGTILISSDGKRWTRSLSHTSSHLTDVVYGNGGFVVVGQDRTALWSSDGVVWKESNLNLRFVEARLTFTNGKFVAYGMGFDWDTVSESTNGQDWAATKIDGAGLFENYVLPDGTIATIDREGIRLSADRKTWRTVPSLEPYGGLIPDGTETFVQSSSGQLVKVMASGNTQVVGKSHRTGLRSIAEGPGTVVATSQTGQVFVSRDWTEWQQISDPTDIDLRSVASGAGRVVAVGWNGVSGSSVNGAQWQFTRLGADTQLTRVEFDGSGFVAVGGQVVDKNSVPIVMTTPDGRNWTTTQLPGRGVVLRGVAFDGKTTVTVGDKGLIFRSQKPGLWEQQTAATGQNLAGIAYGNQRWVAVGLDNTILTSADGSEWSLAQTPFDAYVWKNEIDFLNVRFLGGRFVVVGTGGAVLLSEDGLHWDDGDVPNYIGTLWDVAAINDHQYVFAGSRGLIVGYTSELVPVPGQLPVRGVVRSGDRLIAVGEYGLVMENATLLSCGKRFTDVFMFERGCEEIELLSTLGLVTGHEDGSFDPAAYVTRAQFAKLIVLALGLRPQPDQAATYTDTPGDHWAVSAGYIQAVSSLGLMTGYSDNSFRPEKEITEGEAYKVLVAALGLAADGVPVDLGGSPSYEDPDLLPTSWTYGWVGTAQEIGLLGDAAPYPEVPRAGYTGGYHIRRSDVARLLANYMVIKARYGR